ncbi:MAG: cadherin-like beta sandwich domain-containing protein [Firmicutes bacterium]|nr:cadherin-like beta sandwich domain-containing protein [Bacillota bacterium]
MLQSLEVLNGSLSPKFDCLNNIYTVKVNNDVNYLKIEYKVEENVLVNIIGNNYLKEGENKVLIEVSNNESLETYTLIVTKEESITASFIEPNMEVVEIKKEMPEYTAQLISIVCFVLILIIFKILFLRKKRK